MIWIGYASPFHSSWALPFQNNFHIFLNIKYENQKKIFIFTFLPTHTTGNLLRQLKTHLTGYTGSPMPADISTSLLLFRIRHKGRYKTCLIGTHESAIPYCYTILWLIYSPSLGRNIKGNQQQSFPMQLRTDWRLKT